MTTRTPNLNIEKINTATDGALTINIDRFFNSAFDAIDSGVGSALGLAQSAVEDIAEHAADKLAHGSHLPLGALLTMPRLLTGDEAIGYGLQGSSHTNAVYSSFYSLMAAALASGTATTDTILISNINSVNVTKTVNCKLYNGMRVVDVANVAQVNDLYSTTGSQPYFVVDTTNQTFTLPKNENAIIFTTDTSKGGLYNKDQIVNITGSGIGLLDSLASGAIVKNSDTAFYAYNQGGSLDKGDFDSSKVVNTGNQVQGRSVNHFLYYKIGNTVTNEALVDVGNLQAEIDLKADKNLGNIDATGRNKSSSLSQLSATIIPLTLGASGSSYTASYDGEIVINTTVNQAGVCNAINRNGETFSSYQSPISTVSSGQPLIVSAPMGKGETIQYFYYGAVQMAKFTVTEGGKP